MLTKYDNHDNSLLKDRHKDLRRIDWEAKESVQ